MAMYPDIYMLYCPQMRFTLPEPACPRESLAVNERE